MTVIECSTCTRLFQDTDGTRVCPQGHENPIADGFIDDAETEWSIGGDDGEPQPSEIQYAIEPAPGADARCQTDELCTVIEELPDYRDGARIIRRTITHGPWEYVPAEDLL